METAPRIRSVAPVLCVRRMHEAIDFMVDRLGFRVQGTAGPTPSWASLARDNAEVMLVCGNHPAPAQDWAAYFWVEDVDALRAEMDVRGASPTALIDKDYGCREFEVRMPDGRLIVFAQSN